MLTNISLGSLLTATWRCCIRGTLASKFWRKSFEWKEVNLSPDSLDSESRVLLSLFFLSSLEQIQVPKSKEKKVRDWMTTVELHTYTWRWGWASASVFFYYWSSGTGSCFCLLFESSILPTLLLFTCISWVTHSGHCYRWRIQPQNIIWWTFESRKGTLDSRDENKVEKVNWIKNQVQREWKVWQTGEWGGKFKDAIKGKWKKEKKLD